MATNPSVSDGDEFTALRVRWANFHADGSIDPAIRPEIAASWRRSVESEIASEMESVPIDEGALHGFDSTGQARRHFLGASRSLVDHLAGELSGTNSAVIVCDDSGLLLYRAGAAEILRRTEKLNFIPGGMWDEPSAGTNGIGLALKAGVTAHVSSAEHYCEAFQEFSCIASPVRHPVTREVLGVIDVTIDVSGAASFAPALLTRAAREVEQLMEEQVFGRERELLERYLRGRSGGETPFLTVDRSGHTIIQNARMLHSTGADDVQLVLGLARSALREEVDLTERIELSRGATLARAHLVRQGSEVIGALVSLEQTGRRARGGAARCENWSPIVGRSPAIRKLLDEAGRVAQRRVPAVLNGEPGTGKLTLAGAMHRVSGERGELRIVNCARSDWRQRWRESWEAGGTVVLSRLQSLPDAAQMELAETLDGWQDGEGPWLLGLINTEAEQLRLELLHRIGRVTLAVPPLRDRTNDVELLVADWCRRRRNADDGHVTVRPEALETLAAQRWPGNVRELFNVLDAARLRRGSLIGVEALDLPSSTTGPNGPITLQEIERAAIESALARNGGNVSRTALELEIGRATLQRRLRSYRLLGDDSRT